MALVHAHTVGDVPTDTVGLMLFVVIVGLLAIHNRRNPTTADYVECTCDWLFGAVGAGYERLIVFLGEHL